MEENASDMVKRAATKDIAILVGGDPLMATTHKILYIEAEKQHVKNAGRSRKLDNNNCNRRKRS